MINKRGGLLSKGRFADEDLWLTQSQLAEIYDTTKQNISQHIENILNDGELDINRTVKEFLIVRQEGNRQVQRNIVHYVILFIIILIFNCFGTLNGLINSQLGTWQVKFGT